MFTSEKITLCRSAEFLVNNHMHVGIQVIPHVILRICRWYWEKTLDEFNGYDMQWTQNSSK